MNPFTQSLLKQISDRKLVKFVTHWDALEALVVRVYKSNTITPQDIAEHTRLRAALQRDYPHWQAALSKYWPRTRAAGVPTSDDPFAYLLSIVQASDFVDHWTAMQTLPAAREALNMMLVERLEKGQGRDAAL